MSTTPIYFVFPAEHRREWPKLLQEAARGACSVLTAAPLFRTGEDVFILQAWMLLCQEKGLPFSFHLVEKAPANEICVFHYDSARIKYGLFDCFSIVVHLDRPAVPYADMVVEQNQTPDASVFHLPHWTHPGLIPRNTERGNRLERMGVVGNLEYHPAFLSDPEFLEQLGALGVELVTLGPDAWSDFQDIDVIVALRPWIAPRVLRTKPPIKLINAWAAGTPALLGPEPAYQALRLDPLDYLEVTGPEDILNAVRRLKETPEMYPAMRERCRARADDYAWKNVKGKWLDLFTRALRQKETPSPGVARKYARYQIIRAYNKLLRHTGMWND